MRRAIKRVGEEIRGMPLKKAVRRLGDGVRIMIYGYLSCNFLMARISALNTEERYIVCV